VGITSSAGDGVRVTSSAKDNGVLSSVGGLPDNQFVVPDTIAATNNGQLGFTTLNGRLITIRRNEVDEETRYITEDHGTTGTISEAWDTPPASGSAYDIAYVIEDAATQTGFSLITKRNRDYSLGRTFNVGNTVTGTFSWFALLDGASMESDNNVGATERAFQVEGDGRWDFGYRQAGTTVPGGYLIQTANTDGEFGFEVVAGGDMRAYELFISSVENVQFLLVNDSRYDVDGLQIYKQLYTSEWEGDGTLANVITQGVGTANESLEIDESFACDGWLAIATDGWLLDTLTTGTVRGYQSVGNNQDVSLVSNEGVLGRYINPLWDGPNPVLSWTVSTGTIQERFDYNTTVRNPAGVVLQNARLYLHDGFDNDFQVQESTDALGQVTATALARAWESGTAGSLPTQVRGAFTTRLLRFGQSPFESAVTIDEPINQAITLVNDSGVELSEASADLVSGTVIEHGAIGNPSNLIAFDAGTILFAADDIVVGATSGATGTVRDLTGDAADGTLYIVDRNGIAFQDGENLEVGGTPQAVANLTSGTGGLDLDFHWEVRASNETLADLYSWQASQSAKATPDSWVLEMLRHRVQLFQRSGDNYTTERVDGEGVFVSERGAGTVTYFTSDENWQWTPPTQFTLTLNSIENPSEVRIYENISGEAGDELDGAENVSGSFAYNYEHGGSDIEVITVVFHLNFLPIRLFLTLTNENATIPVTQFTDRVYSNP
jgi:hypothetical protein